MERIIRVDGRNGEYSIPYDDNARCGEIVSAESLISNAISAREASPASLDFGSSSKPYEAVRGEHFDMARGFMLVALPISLLTPAGLLFFLLAGTGYPLLTLWAGGFYLTVFGVLYFLSWLLSQIFSHYGVEFVRLLIEYRILSREQSERFQFYKFVLNPNRKESLIERVLQQIIDCFFTTKKEQR